MPVLESDRRRISYQVHGDSGPAILWLAGTGCPGATWKQQVDHFAQQYRCITYDLPGAGESSVPKPGTCTPRRLADDALALLDELALPAVHCVGFSLGAATAQELALLVPERVESAVLLGTWGSTRRANHIAAHFSARRLALTEAPVDVFRAFGFWIWSSTLRDHDPDRAREVQDFFGELAAGVSTAGYQAHFEADLAHDAFARLGGITCPVLVLHGDEDYVTLPAYNREVADAIPGARRVELRHGGHMVWCERPDDVNAEIEGFLGAQRGTRS